MSHLIPIACPALLGTAGYVSTAPSGALTQRAATATPTDTTAGKRYDMKCGVLNNSRVYGRPGCVTFADGHKPLFP